MFDIPVFFGGNESDKRMFVEKWDRAIFPLEYSDKKPSILDISIGDDRYKYQRIIRDAGIRKGKDWEHENEVRIQVANDLYTPDKHRDVVWQDGWPYYSGLLGYLKGIILGVRCKKRVSWVECQLNALHYTDVNVVRAYESPVDYKVMLRPEDGQIFKDEDEKVDHIRRSFENHVNSQDYDRLWFMKPRFAPVRKGGG